MIYSCTATELCDILFVIQHYRCIGSETETATHTSMILCYGRHLLIQPIASLLETSRLFCSGVFRILIFPNALKFDLIHWMCIYCITLCCVLALH